MSGTSDAPVASEDARAIRRIVVVGSASGSGKTTLARELAAHLAVPFVEVDALYHGPNWTPTPTEILRERVSAVVSQDGWVIDGSYHRQLGTLVLDRAQLLVWLDLPTRVWLPRLLLRSMRRWATGEVLWNGNRESLRDLFWGREALIPYTLERYYRRRHEFGASLAPFAPRRLRSTSEVDAFRRAFFARE